MHFEPREQIDWWGLEYGAISEELMCPICHTVLVRPMILKCGHTFCEKCIQKAREVLASPFKCPIDRLTVDEPPHPAPFLVQNLLDELPVRCPFASRGCTFFDKRWLLEAHVKSQCLRVHVNYLGEEVERHVALEKCAVEQSQSADHERNACSTSDIDEARSLAAPKTHAKEDLTNSRLGDLESRCPGSMFGCESSDVDHDCALARVARVINDQSVKIEALHRQNRQLREIATTGWNKLQKDAFQLDAHILSGSERTRRELEHTQINQEANAKQVMMLARENVRMTEDIAFLRAAVAGLQQQLHHLLLMQRRSLFSASDTEEGLSAVKL